MEKNKLKIASISAELSPFSKSGGLADVACSLPQSIRTLGHTIYSITPLYSKLINKKKYNLNLLKENVKITIDPKNSELVNFWECSLANGAKIYFVEHKLFFSTSKKIYGLPNDNLRFLVFDLAALELIKRYHPDTQIIHCHDWHAGLIPYYLKQTTDFPQLAKAKTIFTIHNLVFQLGQNWWEVPTDKKDKGKSKLPLANDEAIKYINFTKRAILNADAINTVSEQYRTEIMTKNFGQDLHKILKNRENKLFGIINGIDHHAYNPARDHGLFKRYDKKTIERKENNKQYLQKIFKLPINSKIPIICATSRITFQKGFTLILNIIDYILAMDVQVVIMGDGDKNYVAELKKKKKKYKHKLAVVPFHGENQKYETLIYAGSDFFLLPSHHEPCGINQLIAMRYGCIPIVRKVGGLRDTVENYNPTTSQGTGFSFPAFNEFHLYGSIVRALETFKVKNQMTEIITRAMQQASHWTIPAKKYINLYLKVLNK